MKKLFLVLLLVVGLFGCDNNKGYSEVMKIKGITYLYFNGKPAEGFVVLGIEEGHITSKLLESEYEEGLPVGDFKLYDYNTGELRIEAEGKWQDGHTKYKGVIKEYDGRGNLTIVANGEFKLNPSNVSNYNGNYTPGRFWATLIEGEAYYSEYGANINNCPKYGKKYVFYRIHNKYAENIRYHNNGNIREIVAYKNANTIKAEKIWFTFDEKGKKTMERHINSTGGWYDVD